MSAVAVLGAGPAGLVAALQAAEAGHEVDLVEASGRVGGMAASFEIAGQRVDFGSHRLHPATSPGLMSRLMDLLGEDLQPRERNGRIRLRGRWVGFPLRSWDMVRSLPPGFSLRAGRDTLLSPTRRSTANTFADEVQRRLGPTIFREFYEPYARKLYGLDAEELDAELANRRIAASSPLQILARVAQASRVDGRRFYYPKHGYGQIAERLAEAATEAGVRLHLNAPVESVEAGRVTASGIDASVDLVLSTISPAALAHALVTAPPQSVMQALQTVRTRAMVLVYLVVPQDRYTEFDAHYFPTLDIAMARMSEPKNYRDGIDPVGQTVLCAEYPCWPNDEVWNATADEMGERVALDLARAGLPSVTAIKIQVERLPSVYPVYETSTRTARAHIDEWVQSLDGVLTFGRQGLDVPDNLHHVLAMGSAAARAINSDGSRNLTRWRSSLDEFSDHVVQD